MSSTARVTLNDDLRDRALRVLRANTAQFTAQSLRQVKSVRALVHFCEFLEDTVIRALPIEARETLRTAKLESTDDATVVNTLNAYGLQLSPVVRNLGLATPEAFVDELLERAVALKHSDDDAAPAIEAIARSSKRLKLAAALGAEDCSSALVSDEKVRAALARLARTLGVLGEEETVPNDAVDACVLLEKCVASNERFVTPFMSETGAQAARNPPSLGDVPSGVGLADDATVEKAVAVARLLHVNDLRRLQSDVDAFLVSMQEYTADPKTDSRIGRVGR